VNSLLEPHQEKLDETKGYALLAKAAMSAFEDLDEEGLFGAGRKREQLLLVIITADAEVDWTVPSARRLNSAAAFRRFQAAITPEGSYAACDALAVSPDGRSLYFDGWRKTGAKKEKMISQIVACDIRGPRLKRRWTSSFPQDRDSGRELACSQDGATILVLRTQYLGGSAHAHLMRFGRNSKVILKKQRLEGEPAALGVSHDGSRVAVAMTDRTLHFLDHDLQRLKVLELKSWPRSLHFLKSGELLMATGTAILRIDNNLEAKPTAYNRSAFDIVADDDETVLVASH